MKSLIVVSFSLICLSAVAQTTALPDSLLPYKNLCVKDDYGRWIGLPHNYTQFDNKELWGYNPPQTSGTILKAPLSTKVNTSGIDVIAHWFQDFGTEYRRIDNGVTGSLKWYYWSWNFKGDKTTHPGWHPSTWGYDSSRHPLLGYYRGDDPNVLDWQCYWLKEYGVTGVNLVGQRIDTTRWQKPSNENYWIYQLFHKVKNFKGLKYVMWGLSGYPDGGITPKEIESDWTAVLNHFHKRYKNFYSITKNGKVYPAIYLYEAGSIAKIFGNYQNFDTLTYFYIKMAKKYKAAGFGGLAIFARHPTSRVNLDYDELEANGLLYIPAEYSTVSGVANADANNYQHYVYYIKAPAKKAIVNVVTSHVSKWPNPSKWQQYGNTPALFSQLMKKAVYIVKSTPYLPKIIMVYNVSEWGEGGAGLQPNRKDRFGYLKAVKDALRL